MQVSTRVDGVTVKQTVGGDWFNVKTADGTFTTKKRELAEAAKALIGSIALVDFTEREGNINPHTNQPYINRYLDGISGSQTKFDIEPSSNGMSPEREVRIMRQAGAKVAAALLQYLPEGERTPSTLISLSDYFVEYFQNGVTAEALASAPAGVHPDDDIPF